MATTLIPFAPNDSAATPFSAVVTLDGSTYNLSTFWNIYRCDWYFSLTDQSGNLIAFAPLIGSPPDYDIYLAPTQFVTSTLVFRQATQNFEVTS